MIAAQLGQTSSTSSLAGQCMCLHADDLRSPMNGQQHRVDRQNAPEEEEASQQSVGWSYAPILHLNLSPVGQPYS